jgi:GNAT superfamily N-acetyltransferase
LITAEGDAAGGTGPATAAASATTASTALRRLVEDAAAGRFPAADGATEFLPSPDGPVHAVLAFTAHHVVAADVDPDDALAHLDPDDIAAPMGAPFLAWLGERLGAVAGTLDVVLAARAGAGAPPFPDELHEITPDAAHFRISRALRYRTEVRAWVSADRSGILVLGRGLAGRWEAAFEVSPAARGRGLGRTLAAVSMLAVPRGERVFLQVAPGNAASLRAALGAGFHPIGAEVLFIRDGGSPR